MADKALLVSSPTMICLMLRIATASPPRTCLCINLVHGDFAKHPCDDKTKDVFFCGFYIDHLLSFMDWQYKNTAVTASFVELRVNSSRMCSVVKVFFGIVFRVLTRMESVALTPFWVYC